MAQEEGRPLRVSLPPNLLTLPEPELNFPVSHRDWNRIRDRVQRLDSPIPWAGNLMWTCCGIAAAGFLSLCAWYPAYSQLPPDAQLAYSWVAPAMIATIVATVALAALCLKMNKDVRDFVRRDAAAIVEDMDAIAPLSRFPQGGG